MAADLGTLCLQPHVGKSSEDAQRNQFKNKGHSKSFKLPNLHFVWYALVESQTKRKIDDLVEAIYTQ